MIKMENHRTSFLIGEAPKPKASPKNPYKIMAWADISKREQQIFFSEQPSISGDTLYPFTTLSTEDMYIAKWKISAR